MKYYIYIGLYFRLLLPPKTRPFPPYFRGYFRLKPAHFRLIFLVEWHVETGSPSSPNEKT